MKLSQFQWDICPSMKTIPFQDQATFGNGIPDE